MVYVGQTGSVTGLRAFGEESDTHLTENNASQLQTVRPTVHEVPVTENTLL